MASLNRSAVLLSLIVLLAGTHLIHGELIKDLFDKITHRNNKTEDTVKQHAFVCGNGVFTTPNEGDLSPEIIFITNRQSHSYSLEGSFEVAQEYRFHEGNVSLSELEHHGFNPDAPVTFLMHGFTSGYPLQAWLSAIVEAYTLDRVTRNKEYGSSSAPKQFGRDEEGGSNHENHDRNTGRERQAGSGEDENRPSVGGSESQRDRNASDLPAKPVEHNLFIVNWNYAARGNMYPRAVANIPIVASYVTRFINHKLIGEADVDPRRIQLIGHSLGAHLAGYIGKNTPSRLGRIYGLDPAGPCFGSILGSFYPSNKRLAPSDANEVITIQTNSALLGIGQPLGKYSVFVEGGADQPGCKPSSALKSVSALKTAFGDTVSCSHSRAPHLITYRHDQSNSQESCLMVAYACKDWESFQKGQCGVCDERADRPESTNKHRYGNRQNPMEPVECLRIGLEWQYPNSRPSRGRRPSASTQLESFKLDGQSSVTRPPNTDRQPEGPDDSAATRRPNEVSTRRPADQNGDSRNRRAAKEEGERSDGSSTDNSSSTSSSSDIASFQGNNESISLLSMGDNPGVVLMFMKTSDTQPFCVFHYQLVLELNEPFEKEHVMSIILQDSQFIYSQNGSRLDSHNKNSLTSDEFGHKFDDRTYTSLLTSNRKLKKIYHATLMVSDGLKDGLKVLKTLHVNYMSHSDPDVRRRLSSRLCPVKTDADRKAIKGEGANRFYFEPCDRQGKHLPGALSSGPSGSLEEHDNNSERKPLRNTQQQADWSSVPVWGL